MRTVQEGDLPLVVRSLAWYEKHIESGLVCRELGRDRFRSLNNPEVEDLTFDDKLVIVSYALVYLTDGIFRISRHDAVNKRAIDATCLLEPCLETFFKVPKLNILMYAFFQMLAIEEDEFAWKDYQTFGRIAIEMSLSMVKKLREFAGI